MTFPKELSTFYEVHYVIDADFLFLSYSSNYQSTYSNLGLFIRSSRRFLNNVYNSQIKIDKRSDTDGKRRYYFIFDFRTNRTKTQNSDIEFRPINTCTDTRLNTKLKECLNIQTKPIPCVHLGPPQNAVAPAENDTHTGLKPTPQQIQTIFPSATQQQQVTRQTPSSTAIPSPLYNNTISPQIHPTTITTTNLQLINQSVTQPSIHHQ